MGRSLEQILSSEKQNVVESAKAQASDMLLDIHLASLRERVDLTQKEVAEAMGIKQPSVAGMEKIGQDVKLSTLKKYVEATGGKLNLDIELPDGSHFGFSL